MEALGTHQPLFLVEKTLDQMFEKQAAIARMADDDKKWPAQALSEMYKQLPFLSQYDIDIDMDRIDPEAGYAFGSAMLRNKSGRVRAEEEVGKNVNRIRIPIIISDRQLQPFHTFELGGNVYPLTQARLEAAMINPSIFDGAATPPKSPSIVDQIYPPFQQRQGFGMYQSETSPSGLTKLNDAPGMPGFPSAAGPAPAQPSAPSVPTQAAPAPAAAPAGGQPGAAAGGQAGPPAQDPNALPEAAPMPTGDQGSLLDIPFGHEDWAEQFKDTTLYPIALEIQGRGGAQAIAKAKLTLEQQRQQATQLEQQLTSTSHQGANQEMAAAGPGEGELPPPNNTNVPGPEDEGGQPLSYVHDGQPKGASAFARAWTALEKEATGAAPRTLHSGKGVPAMPGIRGHKAGVPAKTAGVPFLQQNRSAKSKEIFSALKRDHPEYPAEMKARIAARKSKSNPESRKSPADGGPAYKAPLHYTKAGKGYKEATTLCGKIAGTLDWSDFAKFDVIYQSKDWRRFVEKNAAVQVALQGLAEAPILAPQERAKLAAQDAAAQCYDVIQVTPIADGGYRVKVSSAPEGMAPVTQDFTAEQAQQALPPEMTQVADEQGAATLTGVEGDPDPLVESMAPVTTFGLYKVMEAGTGRQVIGFVVPTLLDPRTGQASPMALFVNGGQFAFQPQVSGSLVALSFNLPSSPRVRGLGAFWKSNGQTIVVTTPLEVMNEVNVEGRKYYAARTSDGQEIQVVMVDQLKQPFMLPSGELAMPGDWNFLPLDSPVKLEDGANVVQGKVAMRQAQAEKRASMAAIKAWKGGCHLDGPVFAKVGSGEQSWVDGVFHLACAGIAQDVATVLLKEARASGRELHIFGLQPLTSYVDEMAARLASEGAKLAAVKMPRKYCLLKEASALSDTGSVDAVLSLNFINPDNIDTFLENIPRLEEASCKLASLVLATQLGLSQVPQTATVRAMFALEDVVESLKSLEHHRI